MPHSVVYAKSADRQLRKLPKDVQQRIANKVEEIAVAPHACAEGKYRRGGSLKARVGGYRILYDVDDGPEIVTILKIAPRSEAYSKKHLP